MKFKSKISGHFPLAVAFISGVVLFFFSTLILVPEFSCSFFNRLSGEENDSLTFSVADVKQLHQEAEALERSVNRLSAAGNSFLIINTTDNTFRLYRNKKIIGSGLCSTGSLIHLQVDSTRSWLFETPKGVLKVRNKIVDPVWRKPDWAFIEEGLQPPPPDHPSRFEKGVLGDYALDLGNGYLIHGTLYQRLLGMPVTHGCVRLNDSDLKLVYQNMDIGSKVYVY